MTRTNADLGRLLLRLTLGFCVLFHGIAKIQGGVEGIAHDLIALGLPGFIAYGVYVGEVLAARGEFEAVLDELSVRRCPSRANFVLVEIGEKHRDFVRLMSSGGVLVRDRSNDPGCDGCVRITIGTGEQMLEAVEVLRRTMSELRGEGIK